MIKKSYSELVLEVYHLENDVVTSSADNVTNFIEGIAKDDIFD